MFNSHQEEVASGFPIDPPKPSSQAVEETSNDPQGNLHKRASHSGPLVHRAAAWGGKAGKNAEDAPKISTGADLSAMSGLVAARRSLLCEERRDKSSTSQQDISKLYSRFPGSFKEASNSMAKQDQITHVVEGSCQNESGRGGSNDPVLVSSIPKHMTFFFCTISFHILISNIAVVFVSLFYLSSLVMDQRATKSTTLDRYWFHQVKWIR